MFDTQNILSGLHQQQSNGATAMLMQRELNKEGAVAYLKDLIKDDFDIRDPKVLKTVFRYYNLNDLTKTEIAQMIASATAQSQ